MLRVFIGIDLDGQRKQRISQQVKKLQDEFPQLKWVKEQNYHLTLKFLGDIPFNLLEQVKQNLQHNLQGQPSFSVSLTGLGAFPSQKNPRVLWIGIQEGETDLKRLHRCLEEGLVGLGFKKEIQRYHPHLTLARCRSKVPEGLAEKIPGLSFSGPAITASHVTLFQSTLTPHGPIYKSLQSIQLD